MSVLMPVLDVMRQPLCRVVAAPLILGFLAAGCTAETTPPAAPEIQEAWISEARIQADELAGALQQTLREAIMTQGVEAGIDVCHVEAPEIAASLSAGTWQVGRTALRLRHPDNEPTAWQREQLLAMQQMPVQEGRPVEKMRVAYDEGSHVFEYMRAIPMQEGCMACHGPSVDESVLQTIAQRYPDDQATGFLPGELRGAFVVRKTVD